MKPPLLFLPVIAALAATPPQPRPSPTPWAVTAHLARDFVLRVCVTNESDSDDFAVEEMLPWSNRYSITLLATAARGAAKEVLTQPLVLSHGHVRSVLLPARQTKCGEIALDERLPGLRSLRESDDVILFWAYFVSEPPPLRHRLFGGTILLPKAEPNAHE